MRRIDDSAAAATVAGTAPVSTWWLLGDLSEDAPPESLDHVVGPLDLPLTLGPGGVVATALAALGLVVLLVGTARHQVPLRRWGVVLPAVGVAVYAGFTARVVTAGVVGANIGAGLLLLATPLVAWAALGVARAASEPAR